MAMYFGDIPDANKQFFTNLVNTGTPAELQALARGDYKSRGIAPYDVYTIPDPSKITNAAQMVSWANNPNTNLQDSSGRSMTGQAQPGGTYWVPKENIDGAVNPDVIHKSTGLFGGGLGSLILGIGGNMLLPGLGSALGGGLLGAAGAGAIIGGGTAALTGGNVLKGAALGGLGAGVGKYVGSNFSANPASGFAGVSPAQIASTVGKTGIGMLSGASPSQALTSGLASLAGTSAASNFDNPWLKSISGSLASTAVRGGDLGQAAILGGIGGLSQNLASNVDNPALQSLIRQSPGMLNSIMMSAGNNSQRYVPRQPVQNKPPAWVSQAMVALGKKGYSEQQAKQMIQQRGRG